MSEFEIGDRVRVVAYYDELPSDYPHPVGHTGTIVGLDEMDDAPYWRVDLPDAPNIGQDYWLLRDDELEHHSGLSSQLHTSWSHP